MDSPYSTSKLLTLDSGQTMCRTDEHFEVSVRRWQLHGDIIKQLQDKFHDEKLNITKTSYNGVMDALHDLESGQRVDPMDILPGEILTDILKRLTDQKWDDQIGKNIDVLFPLMLVSKKWCQFMMSEHLLWNHIVIKNIRRVGTVKRQLELSGGIPLTLWLDLPLEYWSALRPALIKHRERIEAIVFYELSDLNSPVEGDHGRLRKWLPKVLEELGPLPNLRILRKLFRIDWEDGQHIASGSADKTIRIWEVNLEGDSASIPVPIEVEPTSMSIGSTLIDLEPDSNGWVRTKDEGLLFWLPEDYRIGFTSPAVTVFPNDGRHRVVRLDLSEFCFGTSWMDILK